MKTLFQIGTKLTRLLCNSEPKTLTRRFPDNEYTQVNANLHFNNCVGMEFKTNFKI